MDEILNQLNKESIKAYKKGDVPIGCIIVKNGKIIAKAHNTKQKTKYCFNHAEILAIKKACKKTKDWRLDDCKMYVSLEPCDMCKEVIRQSRIKQIYYLLPSKFDNEKGKTIEYNQLDKNVKYIAEFKERMKSFFTIKR